MRYEFDADRMQEVVLLPARALELCPEAGEAELRVLLFLARTGGAEEAEILGHFSGLLDEGSVREALAFWRGAGLFSKGGSKKRPPRTDEEEKRRDEAGERNVRILSERPNYTSFDLASAVENQSDFKSLVDYAEHRLEKVFNRADLSLLYSFVDYLALPVDVVMLAIEACAKENKKSLRYIEKLLVALADQEIVTYEEADAYFARRAEYLSFEGQVRAMCGFGSRALTAAEKKIITAWKDEKGYTKEELTEAYEKTVNAISKPSVSYMNKVLSTLREQGGEGERSTGAAKTYDRASRFRKAVERTKKKRGEEEG